MDETPTPQTENPTREQAELRAVFDNLRMASRKVLPIVGGAAANANNLVRDMRTAAYNQFREALDAANRIE